VRPKKGLPSAWRAAAAVARQPRHPVARVLPLAIDDTQIGLKSRNEGAAGRRHSAAFPWITLRGNWGKLRHAGTGLTFREDEENAASTAGVTDTAGPGCGRTRSRESEGMVTGRRVHSYVSRWWKGRPLCIQCQYTPGLPVLSSVHSARQRAARPGDGCLDNGWVVKYSGKGAGTRRGEAGLAGCGSGRIGVPQWR
jgi:hypothetical protein